MRARSVAQMRIFHVHVEGVVDLRGRALAECRGPNRFGRAKQNQRLIDQVRAQVPENAGRGIVRLLAPGARFGVEAEAVEARFVFGDRAQVRAFRSSFTV